MGRMQEGPVKQVGSTLSLTDHRRGKTEVETYNFDIIIQSRDNYFIVELETKPHVAFSKNLVLRIIETSMTQ